MHFQRILALAGLLVTLVGGVALLMDLTILGALGLGSGALIGLAGLVSVWMEEK